MPAYRCILVPTDFSTCADQALVHALALVREFGCELHLLHVVTAPDAGSPAPDGGAELQAMPGREAYYRDLEEKAAELLAHLIDAAGTAHTVPIRHTTRRAPAAAAAILDYADEHAADLIVMGTHGRRGAERILIGSTAEKVTRWAPCDVLTVGPQGGRVAALARRILVAVDFSAPSRRALGQARVLAARYDAHLLVVHVTDPVLSPVFYDDHPWALAVSPATEDARLQVALDAFFKRTRGPSVRATCRVARGRPAPTIAALAEQEEVHLIIQGARGFAEASKRPLGRVAEAVVRGAPCPVLTVRVPKRRRTPAPAVAAPTDARARPGDAGRPRPPAQPLAAAPDADPDAGAG